MLNISNQKFCCVWESLRSSVHAGCRLWNETIPNQKANWQKHYLPPACTVICKVHVHAVFTTPSKTFFSAIFFKREMQIQLSPFLLAHRLPLFTVNSRLAAQDFLCSQLGLWCAVLVTLWHSTHYRDKTVKSMIFFIVMWGITDFMHCTVFYVVK